MNPLMELINRYPEEITYFRIAPKDIDVFNKIVEAYDNVALVSTIDPKIAKVAVWTTPDTKNIFMKLVKKIPIKAMLWDDYTKNMKVGEN
jgi:hypothetical protein